MGEHLAAASDLVADCQQQQQRRKQRHQSEVAHCRSRSKKVVLVELMKCM
jgi:hypothetical protein